MAFINDVTHGELQICCCFLCVGDTLSMGLIVGLIIAIIIVIIIVDVIVVVLVLRRLRSRLYRFRITFYLNFSAVIL